MSGRLFRFGLLCAVVAAVIAVTPTVALGAVGLPDTWSAAASTSTSQTLYSVAFSSALHGIATGKGGTILVTDDGGHHWVAASTQATGDDLYGEVTFIDPQHAYVAGELHGWLTSDGGEHWTQAASSTAGSGTSFNGLHGIMGRDGIYYSSDGGNTWYRAWEPYINYANLFGITFIDASHACAVGAGGFIELSSDGGLHWNPVTSGTAYFLDDVTFTDPLHGCAVGDGGTIILTSDGGQHWAPALSNGGESGWIVSVRFSDSSHGVAAGLDGSVLVTSDGGQHWNASAAALTEIRAMTLADASHAVAVGDDGKIYLSAPLPVASTSIINLSVSPSKPSHKKTSLFSAMFSPKNGARTGTSTLSLWHRETKTVTETIKGKRVRVKVKYWHLRKKLQMNAATSGKLTVSYRCSSSGKWQTSVSFTGSPGYAPCASATKSFSVK